VTNPNLSSRSQRSLATCFGSNRGGESILAMNGVAQVQRIFKLRGTYSGGREKSAAMVGKSLAMFAGFSEGSSEDRDLRYSLSPRSI
jgi:hypothetical protein